MQPMGPIGVLRTFMMRPCLIDGISSPAPQALAHAGGHHAGFAADDRHPGWNGRLPLPDGVRPMRWHAGRLDRGCIISSVPQQLLRAFMN